MTATPQPSGVPARSAANVSLNSRVSAAEAARGVRRVSRRASSLGRSKPARQQTASAATGGAAGPQAAATIGHAGPPAGRGPAPDPPPGATSSGRGPPPSSAPSAAHSATSVFELPPSTARRTVAHAGARPAAGQLVDADERRPGRPEAVDDRGQRVERARRPGVEQDDGAVADGRRAGEGVGGHRRAGPPAAPSPRARRRRPRRGSRGPPASPGRAGRRRPPRTGSGTMAAGRRRSCVADHRLGLAHVGRSRPSSVRSGIRAW